ncbi:28632_t:CDS:1, partial [Dentiscutata erythropus]
EIKPSRPENTALAKEISRRRSSVECFFKAHSLEQRLSIQAKSIL